MVVANVFISRINTQTIHDNKSITQSSIAMFTLKPFNLVGLKPGPSVPDVAGLPTHQIATYLNETHIYNVS
jgi:hypothetical protein